MKMYRLNYRNHEIEEFEIVKETDKTVTYTENYHGGATCDYRELKETHRHKWFASWDEGNLVRIPKLIEAIRKTNANLIRLKKLMEDARR